LTHRTLAGPECGQSIGEPRFMAERPRRRKATLGRSRAGRAGARCSHGYLRARSRARRASGRGFLRFSLRGLRQRCPTAPLVSLVAVSAASSCARPSCSGTLYLCLQPMSSLPGSGRIGPSRRGAELSVLSAYTDVSVAPVLSRLRGVASGRDSPSGPRCRVMFALLEVLRTLRRRDPLRIMRAMTRAVSDQLDYGRGIRAGVASCSNYAPDRR
jgi:hypothetical protein